MGPTASGKTDLAVALAKALDGELISVDSALVYRGLDVGSAKPDFPHHLVDICDPAEAYSAARFAQDARAAIAAVRSRGRRPILVGGTMLYYRALLQGFAEMPPANAQLRAAIAAQAAREGWPAVHRELAEVDPDAAGQIHPNHSQRISRALEVFRLTGTPLSQMHRAQPGSAAGEPGAMAFAVAPLERSVLHERIERRLSAMLAAGFLDEVRALHARKDLHPGLPAIRAVGYRQLWAHLDGESDLEEAVRRAAAATRQLAKRQFTWLRKWPDLSWIHTDADGFVLQSDLATPAIVGSGKDPANLLLNYLARDPM